MKILSVVLFLVIVALCKSDYSDKQKGKLERSSEQCMKDLDIAENSGFEKKLKYGGFKEKDDLTKKFISCTMQKVNFINKEGTIQQENLVEFLVDKYNRTQALDVIGKCSKSTKESVEDKATEFYDCFFLEKSFEI